MILPLVFILFYFYRNSMDIIFFATILCDHEWQRKSCGLYESDSSPITVTHVIKLWKKLCQSVVVEEFFFFFQ